MTFEEILQLNPNVWPFATVAFLRVLSIFIWLPILGEQEVPGRLRVLLALCFTIAIWPGVETSLGPTLSEPWGIFRFTVVSFWEVFLGVAVGFAARSLIHAAVAGAELAGVNMGFQVGQMMAGSPGMGETVFSRLYSWIVLMLFLGLNIHHVFFQTIASSFTDIPVGRLPAAEGVLNMAIHVIKSIFELGLRLAAPLLVIQFLTSLALVAVARSVPQFNVFMVNFPVSFLLGMVIMFFGMSTMVAFLAHDGMQVEIHNVRGMFRAFAPDHGATQ